MLCFCKWRLGVGGSMCRCVCEYGLMGMPRKKRRVLGCCARERMLGGESLSAPCRRPGESS